MEPSAAAPATSSSATRNTTLSSVSSVFLFRRCSISRFKHLFSRLESVYRLVSASSAALRAPTSICPMLITLSGCSFLSAWTCPSSNLFLLCSRATFDFATSASASANSLSAVSPSINTLNCLKSSEQCLRVRCVHGYNPHSTQGDTSICFKGVGSWRHSASKRDTCPNTIGGAGGPCKSAVFPTLRSEALPALSLLSALDSSLRWVSRTAVFL
mmetsp:Transcript_23990/g.40265  ORF Transcript_23990/g.40265 Transcript_23990/m.40265 type:complete len:214 (+) Transcript_23990:1861-2502(+)